MWPNHNNGAGTSGARPIVVESIMVDGKAANIAIQPIPNDSLTTYTHTKFRLYADLFFVIIPIIFRLVFDYYSM